ncbi:MAG: bifunctional response regulator/alkaline phosphatase family protein [Bacteroidota bacterium]|jgi:CheY-like chemotaxis protein|nr:bifunctional response regulator/alkaline phosphatase family protein [Bacteroidota bacterium]
MSVNILWTDDEIDLLKPHILFLTNKGYVVDKATNGIDALEKVKTNNYDVIFLDENMPGISGIETLLQIKVIKPDVPVVMITKSEEEHIMEDAIGNQIADYLIKPVNSNQILLSLKRILDGKQLVTEKTAKNYQQEFRQLSMDLSDVRDFEGWTTMYRKLIYWELELAKSGETGMDEILAMQKRDANNGWSKFVKDNFINFLKKPDAKTPVMSHTVVNKKLIPLLKDETPTFLILIDNFRFDQWKVVQNTLNELFNLVQEETYMTILPTTTHYARNSFFAGMLPLEIEKLYPNLWVNEEDEEGKNIHEEDLLGRQLQRSGFKDKFSYTKVTHLNAGKDLVDSIPNMWHNKLNVIVYNFVDMLSHARTEMNVMKELAENEAAYRSITASWFEHSPLYEAIKKIASKKARIVITTDHGSIRVNNPVKIVGDRSTSTNLRYKQGRNLNYNEKELFSVKNPADAFLPKQNMSTSYVFAMGEDFMAYPNNYNYHVKMYNNSFQHGGISLEEMIVPFVVLETK